MKFAYVVASLIFSAAPAWAQAVPPAQQVPPAEAQAGTLVPLKLSPAEYLQLTKRVDAVAEERAAKLTEPQTISPQVYLSLLNQIPLSDPIMVRLTQIELEAQRNAEPTPMSPKVTRR